MGYLNGREDHAKSGEEIARPFLESNGFKPNEIDIICDAISRHGGKDESDYQSPIPLCLVLADKLDFVASRYNLKIKDHPVSLNFVSIKKLDLELGEKITLNFFVKPFFNSEEFEQCHFGKKLKLVFSMLSKALDKPYEFNYHFINQ